MIGRDFDNLAQRVVYGWLASYPDFAPVTSPEASEESQRQMHAFLRGVISGIYAHPEVLGIEPAPDDCYEGAQVNNTRPELIKLMRKAAKPVVDFYGFLQTVGLYGALKQNRLQLAASEVKAKRVQLQALRAFGIGSETGKGQVALSSERHPGVFPAWKLLAHTTAPQGRSSPFLFSHCVFDTDRDYLFPMLTGLDPASARGLAILDEHLRAEGYDRQTGHEGAEIWGVSYRKDGERRFDIQYDSRKRLQLHYVLRLNHFTSFWQRFPELDAAARQLLVEMTRPCRGCGGCRKINIKTMGPFTTDVTGESKTLCPWYPDSEWWGHVSEEQLAGIRSLLAWQETILRERG